MDSYSEHVKTNIDWIGDIPNNWSLKKIKYLFWERKDKNEFA